MKIDQLPFKTRTLVVCIVPLVLVFLLISYLCFQSYRDYSASKYSTQITQALSSLNEVVHELQKERGMSATYVSSKGKIFRVELDAQKKLTDTSITRMQSLLNDKNLAVFSSSFRGEIISVKNELAKLSTLRQNISDLKTTVPRLEKQYTYTITKIIETFDNLLETLQSTTLVSQTAAFINFAYAKEFAGLERAAGDSAIGAGKMTEANLQKNLILQGNQAGLIQSFFLIANDDLSNLKQDIYSQSNSQKDFDRHREELFASFKENRAPNIVISDWWKTSTARIDRFHEAEAKILKGIQNSARQIAHRSFQIFIGLLATTIVLMLGFIYFIIHTSRGMIQQLNALINDTDKLAAEDFTIEIQMTNRSDELGGIARNLELFKERMISNREFHTNQRKLAKVKEKELYKIMSELTSSLENKVNLIVNSASEKSDKAEEICMSMARALEKIDSEIADITGTCTQASETVSQVDEAATTLASAMQAVNGETERSKQVVKNAVSAAEQSNKTVTQLSETSAKIEGIVSLISDIANQTNLLALNATIEAARAGEAGKGFAVVASEVKNLAGQTGKATEEITSQISKIQAAARDSVKAISSITESISNVSGSSDIISQAISDQERNTRHIARSSRTATDSTTKVTENIAIVNDRTKDTSAKSKMLQSSIGDLKKDVQALYNTLQNVVNDFRRNANSSLNINLDETADTNPYKTTAMQSNRASKKAS